MMRYIWLFLLFLVGFGNLCFGQAPKLRFEHYGTEEGIPNMSIQDIYQDQYGFLWIGTWDGLSLFDGYNFTNYHRIPFDRTSLSNNDIQAITEDSAGNIWLATQNGVNRFNRNQKSFTRFLENDDPRGVISKLTQIAYTDPQNKTWFSFSNRNTILSFDQECVGFEQHTTERDLLSMISWQNYLLIGNRKRLIVFDKVTNQMVPTDSVIVGAARLEKKSVTDILIGQDGAIWFATLAGLFRYDPISHNWTYLNDEDGLNHNNIYTIAEDQAGGIWIGTYEGLNYVSEEGKVLGGYMPNPQDPFSLSGKVVTSLLIDQAGNLWIGTYRGGLSKVRLNLSQQFYPYTNTFFGEKYLNIIVLSIAEGKENRLWIGTNNGLFLLDKKKKKIIKQYTKGKDAQMSLMNNNITAVYEDDFGKVYIGVPYFGLDVLDLNTDQITHYRYADKAPNSPKSIFIRTIRESLVNQKRVIWLTGSSGFQGHDPENDLIITHHYQAKKPYNYKAYSWDLIPLDSCTVFSAHNNGVLRTQFCQSGEDSVQFLLWNTYLIAEPGFPIISLLPINRDRLWAGSYGAGLFELDLPSGELKNYTRENGLANNYIYGILEDNTGTLWMSTNQGISSFDPKEKVFTNFNPTEGLQIVEFSSGAFLKASDGEMFFGGVNGFTSFYPDSIEFQSSSYQAPIQITSIKVSGEELQTDSAIYLMKEVKLPGYKKQYLEIRYSALDYSQSKKNNYQYRLKGYDTDWTAPSPLNIAQYTQLEPGDYTFEVRGSNSDGIFNEEIHSIQIILIPLWHQALWFRLGGSLLILTLIGLAIYLRIQTLRNTERLRLYSQIARVKQEALTAQMDHHFTFNSLNSIQRYIIENNREEAIRFISKFGKLIRKVLDQATRNYQTIEEEINTLELYLKLEQHRTRDKFSYEFNIEETVDIYNTELPTNLLQPFLENAIWHGIMPLEERKGLIAIRFLIVNEKLVCQIEDNGIGRKKAAELKRKSKLQHQSKGMRIIEERIEALNFLYHSDIQSQIIDLDEAEGNEMGTRVELWMSLT